ncbi:hypothetical protein HYH03_001707 [Edaphochlamys debaryana]|uniref:Protein kinase domain-containing protein n=1 Tax=Edaphochlamys debaryana TaxID=47281 RepID=A0A836C4R2_9CHLO|nr:hypothetical protein HYH03_001707 [Edaphochlamys debaryana]|eukprot:KAG2500125.1 hypothetical protein HYH03_001707 [Edaphochlamys debaryana]
MLLLAALAVASSTRNVVSTTTTWPSLASILTEEGSTRFLGSGVHQIIHQTSYDLSGTVAVVGAATILDLSTFAANAISLQSGSSLRLSNLTLLLPPLPEAAQAAPRSLLAHLVAAAGGKGGGSLVLRGVTLVAASCQDLSAFATRLCDVSTWGHTTTLTVEGGVVHYKAGGSMALGLTSANATPAAAELEDVRVTCVPVEGGGSSVAEALLSGNAPGPLSPWPCLALAVANWTELLAVLTPEALAASSLAVLVTLTGDVDTVGSWQAPTVPVGLTVGLWGVPESGDQDLRVTRMHFFYKEILRVTVGGRLLLHDVTLTGLPYPATVTDLAHLLAAWRLPATRRSTILDPGSPRVLDTIAGQCYNSAFFLVPSGTTPDPALGSPRGERLAPSGLPDATRYMAWDLSGPKDGGCAVGGPLSASKGARVYWDMGGLDYRLILNPRGGTLALRSLVLAGLPPSALVDASSNATDSSAGGGPPALGGGHRRSLGGRRRVQAEEGATGTPPASLGAPLSGLMQPTPLGTLRPLPAPGLSSTAAPLPAPWQPPGWMDPLLGLAAPLWYFDFDRLQPAAPRLFLRNVTLLVPRAELELMKRMLAATGMLSDGGPQERAPWDPVPSDPSSPPAVGNIFPGRGPRRGRRLSWIDEDAVAAMFASLGEHRCAYSLLVSIFELNLVTWYTNDTIHFMRAVHLGWTGEEVVMTSALPYDAPAGSAVGEPPAVPDPRRLSPELEVPCPWPPPPAYPSPPRPDLPRSPPPTQPEGLPAGAAPDDSSPLPPVSPPALAVGRQGGSSPLPPVLPPPIDGGGYDRSAAGGPGNVSAVSAEEPAPESAGSNDSNVTEPNRMRPDPSSPADAMSTSAPDATWPSSSSPGPRAWVVGVSVACSVVGAAALAAVVLLGFTQWRRGVQNGSAAKNALAPGTDATGSSLDTMQAHTTHLATCESGAAAFVCAKALPVGASPESALLSSSAMDTLTPLTTPAVTGGAECLGCDGNSETLRVLGGVAQNAGADAAAPPVPQSAQSYTLYDEPRGNAVADVEAGLLPSFNEHAEKPELPAAVVAVVPVSLQAPSPAPAAPWLSFGGVVSGEALPEAVQVAVSGSMTGDTPFRIVWLQMGAARRRSGPNALESNIHQLKARLMASPSDSEQCDGREDVALTGLLGRGAHGVVYSGTWRGLAVAVKVVVMADEDEGVDEQMCTGPSVGAAAAAFQDVRAPRARRRAVLEAAISSTLDHPNLVRAYAYEIRSLQPQPLSSRSGSDGQSSGRSMDSAAQQLLIVMELCEKGSLKDALATGSLRSITAAAAAAASAPEASAAEAVASAAATALALALDVACGLAHLHAQGIVHGDLSPGNILLTSREAGGQGPAPAPTAPLYGVDAVEGSGEAGPLTNAAAQSTAAGGGWASPMAAKLCDFGLAVRLRPGASHTSGAFGGTPAYAAPELAASGRLGRASDVFSLGVVMAELAAGPSAAAALRDAACAPSSLAPAPPPPLSALLVGSSGETLWELAVGCTAAEPKERPGSSLRLSNLTLLLPLLPEAAQAAPRSLLAHLVAAAGGEGGGSLVLQGVTLVAASCQDLSAFATRLCDVPTWGHTTTLTVEGGVVHFKAGGSMALGLTSANATPAAAELEDVRVTCVPVEGGGSSVAEALLSSNAPGPPSPWPCTAVAVDNWTELRAVLTPDALAASSLAVLVTLTGDVDTVGSWQAPTLSAAQVPVGLTVGLWGVPESGDQDLRVTRMHFFYKEILRVQAGGRLLLHDVTLTGLPYPATVTDLAHLLAAWVWAFPLVESESTLTNGSSAGLALPAFECTRCDIVLASNEVLWWGMESLEAFNTTSGFRIDASLPADQTASFWTPDRWSPFLGVVLFVHDLYDTSYDSPSRALHNCTLVPADGYAGGDRPGLGRDMSSAASRYWPLELTLGGIEQVVQATRRSTILDPHSPRVLDTIAGQCYNGAFFFVPSGIIPDPALGSPRGERLAPSGLPDATRYMAWDLSGPKDGGCAVGGPLSASKAARVYWDMGGLDYRLILNPRGGTLALRSLVLAGLPPSALVDTNDNETDSSAGDGPPALGGGHRRSLGGRRRVQAEEGTTGTPPASLGVPLSGLMQPTPLGTLRPLPAPGLSSAAAPLPAPWQPPGWMAPLMGLAAPLWYFDFDRLQPRAPRLFLRNVTLLVPRAELELMKRMLAVTGMLPDGGPQERAPWDPVPSDPSSPPAVGNIFPGRGPRRGRRLSWIDEDAVAAMFASLGEHRCAYSLLVSIFELNLVTWYTNDTIHFMRAVHLGWTGEEVVMTSALPYDAPAGSAVGELPAVPDPRSLSADAAAPPVPQSAQLYTLYDEPRGNAVADVEAGLLPSFNEHAEKPELPAAVVAVVPVSLQAPSPAPAAPWLSFGSVSGDTPLRIVWLHMGAARRRNDPNSLKTDIYQLKACLASESGSRQSEGREEVALTGLLGRGAHGVVYSGTWRGLAVAVKVVVMADEDEGVDEQMCTEPSEGDNTNKGAAAAAAFQDVRACRVQRRAVLEAAISSTLDHPNLVRAYAYEIRSLQPQPSPLARGSDGPGGSSSIDSGAQQLLIVMELCEKGSLKDALATGSLRSITAAAAVAASAPEASAAEAVASAAATALALALDVACGLAHLHAQGIVHGDLSPGNILLTSREAGGQGPVPAPTAPLYGVDAVEGSGEAGPLTNAAAQSTAAGGGWGPPMAAKLCDFGLAVRLRPGASHTSGAFGGTPAYAAPELAASGRLGRASDVFSLGVVMAELAAGPSAAAALRDAACAPSSLAPASPPAVPPLLAGSSGEALWQLAASHAAMDGASIADLSSFAANAINLRSGSSLRLSNLTLLLPPLPEAAQAAPRSLLAHLVAAAGGEGGGSLVLQGVTLVAASCQDLYAFTTRLCDVSTWGTRPPSRLTGASCTTRPEAPWPWGS